MPVSKQDVLDLFSTVYSDYFETRKIVENDGFGWTGLILELTSPTVRIKIHASYGDDVKVISVSGDTLYLSFGTWYTFTRRGHEDSFYSPYSGLEGWDINLTVLEQIERAENAIVRAQDAGPRIEIFPGISVTQARLDADAEKLRSFKSVSYTPASMGTGYKVSQAPVHYSYPVPPKVQQLLKSTKKLYYTTIDCD